MTQREKNNVPFPSWLISLITIITLLIGLGVSYGTMQAQLQRQEDEIELLQRKADEGTTDRLSIETRLTRIETDVAYIRALLERMEHN